MPRFIPADIDEVRERADIVEVVQEHVRLRRAGRSYTGLCPFHQEKTPSFTVDREKGLFFCFGCRASGNVFHFVQQIEGLTFAEAVERLAGRVGVELREVSGGRKTESPRARLVALHDAAVEHYRKLLEKPDAAAVRAYLDERGITPEQRERYRIGFGGVARDGLVRVMLRRGFTGNEMIEAGLASRDGRAMRDTFFGRLLFPIFDPSDRPVGFGGRVLPDAYRPPGVPDQPKYLNSRESPIFRKSRILYGANWARGDVHRAKRLVLVEGYTDVIATHAAGVAETVATCGTALTEEHMKEISRRFGDVRVILCLDADAAGLSAAAGDRTEQLAGAYSPGERVAGGTWLPVGRGWLPEVYVASLPAGRDPADFAAEAGGRGLAAVLDGAVPIVEFLLRRALEDRPLASPEDRARAIRRGAQVLRQVGDSLIRHEYALWLADRVGVDAYEVVKAVGDTAPAPRRREAAAPQPAELSGHHRVEREALRALVAVPELFDDPFAANEDDFTLPVHRTVFRLIVQERKERGTVDAGRLATDLGDEEIRRLVTSLVVGRLPDEVGGRETLVRLKEFALSRNIEERKRRLRTLDPDREAAAYDALFEELLELERERRSLANGSGAT